MRQGRFTNFIPFRYKLLFAFMLFVTVTVSAAGYFSYRFFTQSIMENTEKNIHSTLDQIKENIYYRTETIVRLSDRLYLDHELQKYLTISDKKQLYLMYYEYVEPILSLHVTNNSIQNIWISLYSDHSATPVMYQEKSKENPVSGIIYEIYQLDDIKKELWYNDKGLQDGGVVWSQVGTDKQYHNISLTRKIYDLQNPPFLQIGFLKITIRMDEIFHAMDYRKMEPGTVLQLLDENGESIFVSSEKPLSPDWESTQDNHLIIQEHLPEVDATLVAFIPTDQLALPDRKIRDMIVTICLIGFIILSIASYFVSHYFSARVKRIVASLHAFRDGDFYQRLEYNGKDEFGQISDAFNEMASEIKQLIHEVYIKDIQKKEAELELLQSQINPHFLYNTLSSVSRLSQLGENEKTHQMVMELAKFYRLALNHGKSIISVEKELQHAQAYLIIQKMKYNEEFTYDWRINRKVYDYDTVKLILQPFLENVLEHAWSDETIHILIEADVNGSELVFRISDNGIGMTQETINQIFCPAGEGLGYGIRNVDERIKLQFGQEYGVRIESQVDRGTKVEIRTPVFREN